MANLGLDASHGGTAIPPSDSFKLLYGCFVDVIGVVPTDKLWPVPTMPTQSQLGCQGAPASRLVDCAVFELQVGGSNGAPPLAAVFPPLAAPPAVLPPASVPPTAVLVPQSLRLQPRCHSPPDSVTWNKRRVSRRPKPKAMNCKSELFACHHSSREQNRLLELIRFTSEFVMPSTQGARWPQRFLISGEGLSISVRTSALFPLLLGPSKTRPTAKDGDHSRMLRRPFHQVETRERRCDSDTHRASKAVLPPNRQRLAR